MNTPFESVTNTPVLIGPEGGFVMNILRVHFQTTGTLDQTNSSYQVSLTGRTSPASLGPNDPSWIAGKSEAGVALVNGGWVQQSDRDVDLSDGNGNGFLFSGKQLFLQIGSAGNSVNLITAACAILYTLKKVGPSELVGVLASTE